VIKKLPFKIRYEAKGSYGVSVVSGFPEPLDGTCNPNTKEIKIRAGMGDKATVSALLHEVIHMISFERSLELTESQVLGLEIGLWKVLELNPSFKKLLDEASKNVRRAKAR
jgi:hypothetical protein